MAEGSAAKAVAAPAMVIIPVASAATTAVFLLVSIGFVLPRFADERRP
jgi:hypothetical protein